MSTQKDIQVLLDLVSSQQTLLTQYLASLSPTNNAQSASRLPPNPPNPLHVLRDSATLLKAHTTKLGLLLINKPFTATAIQKILRDVSQTCLPAMMTAVEICTADVWGLFLRQQVVARVRTVIREVDVCLNDVRQVATEDLDAITNKTTAAAKTSRKQDRGRDSLTSTGVVWEACDRLIELESVGIGGLAVKKAEEWRDMVKDAIEELKEWEQGEGDDDDDDDDDGGSDEPNASDGEDSDKDSVDDMFSAANSMPKNRPDLTSRLATTNDKLKKIQMLYAAVIKRRLTTFTQSVSSVQANVVKLDKLLHLLKELPETVDDLASAFYDLETAQIDQVLGNLVANSKIAAKMVQLGWDGSQDAFTTWTAKWLDVMN